MTAGRQARRGGAVETIKRGHAGTAGRVHPTASAGRGQKPQPLPSPIRILIVDGQRLFREGMRALLERYEGMEVVADAGSTAEAASKVAPAMPDVIVTAFSLPHEEQGMVLRELQALCPGVPLVVLGGDEVEDAPAQALQAGARGFLLKDASADLVVKAIEAVHAGQVWVQREVMARVIGRVQGPRPDQGRQLSPREYEILHLLVTGATTQEIAEALFVSSSTVRVHIASIFTKLHVRNRVEAVRYALQQGLIR